MIILSGSGSPHVAWSTAPRLALFFILICGKHKNTSCNIFGTVPPWCLFWYYWPSIAKYKTWSTYCYDWPFFLLVRLPMMSGTRTQKKLPIKLQQKTIVEIFTGGVSMSGLKGKRVGDYLQRKWISKNCPQDVERVDESKIVPNRHVFVLIVGQETEEKMEKYSQSGYCFSARKG